MEKFSTSKDGYNKDEVNKFVNDVIIEVESMISKLKEKDRKNALEEEKRKKEIEARMPESVRAEMADIHMRDMLSLAASMPILNT